MQKAKRVPQQSHSSNSAVVRKRKSSNKKAENSVFFANPEAQISAQFPEDIIVAKRPLALSGETIIIDDLPRKRKKSGPAPAAKKRSARKQPQHRKVAAKNINEKMETLAKSVPVDMPKAAASDFDTLFAEAAISPPAGTAIALYRKHTIFDKIGYWFRQHLQRADPAPEKMKKIRLTPAQIKILIDENLRLRAENETLRIALAARS